jgi:hypothetical protein
MPSVGPDSVIGTFRKGIEKGIARYKAIKRWITTTPAGAHTACFVTYTHSWSGERMMNLSVVRSNAGTVSLRHCEESSTDPREGNPWHRRLSRQGHKP